MNEKDVIMTTAKDLMLKLIDISYVKRLDQKALDNAIDDIGKKYKRLTKKIAEAYKEI